MSEPAARLADAAARFAAGDLDAAEAACRDVLSEYGDHAEALNLLALVALSRGDFDEALAFMETAVGLAPHVGEYWHLLGRIRMELGDLDAAAADLAHAISGGVSHVPPADLVCAHLDLALCHTRRGAWADAQAAADALLAIAPDNVYALRAAANAAMAQDNVALAETYYARAIAADPGDAAAWEGLARIDRKKGDPLTALSRLERAVALEPDNAEYAYMRRVVAAEVAPAWHFNMMNDQVRNAAFAAAIARQVRPGQLVFEIGAGAGLLAMLAARAGAEVVTCESNPAIAAVARDIVAHNGLGGRITVLDKASWELAVGAGLPRPADVLMAEIFSAQLLSEDVIPSLEDAKARLLAPGGVVIPAMGVMRGALVDSDQLAQLTRVGHVEGFDLSAFNTFSPPLMNLEAPNTVLTWLSDPVDLFAFDFQNEDRWPRAENEVAVAVTRSGLCQGVVQWLWLALDDATTYENPPLGPKGLRTPHWTPLLYTFPEAQALTAGQTVTLRVVHDRKGARVDLAGIT
ncbi:MAG: tetratricopeptide repeat protein [Rhodospirillaceae bacterium]|nr:tetratricopeptide repeat protein [Rhodospirillaceae bacterium]